MLDAESPRQVLVQRLRFRFRAILAILVGNLSVLRENPERARRKPMFRSAVLAVSLTVLVSACGSSSDDDDSGGGGAGTGGSSGKGGSSGSSAAGKGG